MKIQYLLFFASFFFISLGARGQSIFDKWPALDSYHEVMAATFHPSEEGNLAPLKARSGDLKIKADMLAASEVPAEFNSVMIISAVKQLKKDSKKLDKIVQKGKMSDAELVQSMSDLHDVFHNIVGLCQEGKQ